MFTASPCHWPSYDFLTLPLGRCTTSASPAEPSPSPMRGIILPSTGVIPSVAGKQSIMYAASHAMALGWPEAPPGPVYPERICTKLHENQWCCCSLNFWNFLAFLNLNISLAFICRCISLLSSHTGCCKSLLPLLKSERKGQMQGDCYDGWEAVCVSIAMAWRSQATLYHLEKLKQSLSPPPNFPLMMSTKPSLQTFSGLPVASSCLEEGPSRCIYLEQWTHPGTW